MTSLPAPCAGPAWSQALTGPLARPDGTFTTDRPFIAATCRKECAGEGWSPWALGLRDSNAVVANVACARLFGVPKASITEGLLAEKATLTETDDSSTISTNDILGEAFGELLSWLDEPLPDYSKRTDGFRSVPVASATSLDVMKAFGVYRFDAAQLVDGDVGTSWQPKKANGAWVELKLNATQAIAAIDIASGFQRSDKLVDLFALNSCATWIAVVAGGKTFDLAVDLAARGFQRIDLPEIVTTDTIRILVKASAKGSRWDHLAFSKIVPLAR